MITLVDPATGAMANVLPQLGFNCFSYTPIIDEEPVELLWSAAGFESGSLKSTASGIPILFPYAGRLSGTSLRFEGGQWPLVIDQRQGYAIHGFVHNRSWRVVAQGPSTVTGEFHASKDDPSLLELWPSDFRIRVCYEVHHAGLTSSISIDNPGQRPLPFGLGTHGYFRLPLGNFGNRDECQIFVPAESYWELDKMIPTGRKLPAAGRRGLSSGLKFGDSKLDDVFTDLAPRDGRVVCRLLDPMNNRRFSMIFDNLFTDCVVFNPPHRESICIEPYTATPDAFALAEHGIDAGLRILQPGEAFQSRIEMRLDDI
jgi:aldose 1-epimerase